MPCCFVVTLFVMLGRFFMMLRSLLMMFSGLLVVLRTFMFRHTWCSPFEVRTRRRPPAADPYGTIITTVSGINRDFRFEALIPVPSYRTEVGLPERVLGRFWSRSFQAGGVASSHLLARNARKCRLNRCRRPLFPPLAPRELPPGHRRSRRRYRPRVTEHLVQLGASTWLFVKAGSRSVIKSRIVESVAGYGLGQPDRIVNSDFPVCWRVVRADFTPRL